MIPTSWAGEPTDTGGGYAGNVLRTTYLVTGMTCEHCAAAVTRELQTLPGVRDVQVDLPAGTVTVASDGPLPLDEVRGAVDEAGYALAGTGA
jgi:copper chaperone